MPFRSFLLVLIILSSLISTSFCEDFNGKKLSDEIYSFLVKNNVKNISKYYLSATGQDDYSYNIFIDYPTNYVKKEIEEATPTNQNSQNYKKNSMILSFLQEDFFSKKELFLDFFNYINKIENRTVNVKIFLSTLDKPLFENDNSSITGTKIFTQEIDNKSDFFSIILNFDDIQKNKILTGNIELSTPLWLTKQIVNIFTNTNTDFEFSHPLLSLYRLGILKGNDKMSYFINSNIPAIAITLCDYENNKEFIFLKNLVEKIDVSESQEWDTHYIFLQLPSPLKPVWLNERIFIISCIIVAFTTLLILCGLSFIGKSGARYKKDFIRSWYMIPLTIGVSIFTLVAGQQILIYFDFFRKFDFVFLFGLKISFSIIFITILFAIQETFRIPIASFVYGYTISIIAILNIFIFSAVDILFFVAFSVEYVIIYLARTAKRVPFLVFWAIMMITPFIPYVFITLKNIDEANLKFLVFCSLEKNIILSFSIFPFQIMWQRILVRLNIFSALKGYSIFRAFISNVISISILIVLTLSGTFFITKYMNKKEEIKPIEIVKKENEEIQNLSVKIIENEFLGMNSNHIKITSKENALRYCVKISSKDQVPIYESTYNYSISNTNSAIFNIPDYPPKNITIDYAADSNLDSTINVEAYYLEKTENGERIILESKVLKITKNEKSK